MPKTSMYKDSDLVLGQYKVRGPRKILAVKPET
jgi:hypothetical protein